MILADIDRDDEGTHLLCEACGNYLGDLNDYENLANDMLDAIKGLLVRPYQSEVVKDFEKRMLGLSLGVRDRADG